jgi:hypothetical protein
VDLTPPFVEKGTNQIIALYRPPQEGSRDIAQSVELPAERRPFITRDKLTNKCRPPGGHPDVSAETSRGRHNPPAGGESAFAVRVLTISLSISLNIAVSDKYQGALYGYHSPPPPGIHSFDHL